MGEPIRKEQNCTPKKLAKWVKNSFSVGNVLYASACAFITYINDVGFF